MICLPPLCRLSFNVDVDAGHVWSPLNLDSHQQSVEPNIVERNWRIHQNPIGSTSLNIIKQLLCNPGSWVWWMVWGNGRSASRGSLSATGILGPVLANLLRACSLSLPAGPFRIPWIAQPIAFLFDRVYLSLFVDKTPPPPPRSEMTYRHIPGICHFSPHIYIWARFLSTQNYVNHGRTDFTTRQIAKMGKTPPKKVFFPQPNRTSPIL